MPRIIPPPVTVRYTGEKSIASIIVRRMKYHLDDTTWALRLLTLACAVGFLLLIYWAIYQLTLRP
jgi:hypothetical protein